MAWFREWSWKIALLALPWQTRWIIDDANSVYVSWIFLVLAILVGWSQRRQAKSPDPGRVKILVIALLILFVSSLATNVPMGTVQWWAQVTLLALFGWSLVVSRVDSREFLIWSVISLVPHALLAIQQGITQEVIGSKWLGIAPQVPETRGVSVVDVGGTRYLRAYGGMPYPNTLGGWLAFALPASLYLATRDPRPSNHFPSIAWTLVGSLFVVALVLTHSRSAWIALIICLVILCWKRFRVPGRGLRVAGYGTTLLIVLCPLLLAILWQWPLLVTRVTADGRLEERSVSERVSGMHAGFTLLLEHPFVGIGRNAFGTNYPEYPLPHNVPLLALVEAGLVGFLALLVIGYALWTSSRFDKRKGLIIAAPLLVLAIFDHYLWSYWPGQALAALLIIWCFLENRGVDKTLKLG